MKLPRAILFDLDDTILVAFGPARSVATHYRRLRRPARANRGDNHAAVIEAATTELWADPARHKYWRHRTGAARRRIVATAFAALAATGHPVPPRRSVTHWPTPITPCAALRPGSRRLALPVGGLTCQRDV